MFTAACKKCGEAKSLSLFPRRGKDPESKVRTAECKACRAAYMRAYNCSTPERIAKSRERAKHWQARHPRSSKKNNLKARHGMALEEYEAMVVAQKGVCAICQCEDRDIVKRSGKRRELAVDHCHDTGVVRSLLCGDCNRALGLVRESPVILAKMISYLARFGGRAGGSMKDRAA